MNIGFIGTGIMGKPMAYNLQQAGHTLYFQRILNLHRKSLLVNVALFALHRVKSRRSVRSSSPCSLIPHMLRMFFSIPTMA